MVKDLLTKIEETRQELANLLFELEVVNARYEMVDKQYYDLLKDLVRSGRNNLFSKSYDADEVRRCNDLEEEVSQISDLRWRLRYKLIPKTKERLREYEYEYYLATSNPVMEEYEIIDHINKFGFIGGFKF